MSIFLNWLSSAVALKYGGIRKMEDLKDLKVNLAENDISESIFEMSAEQYND